MPEQLLASIIKISATKSISPTSFPTPFVNRLGYTKDQLVQYGYKTIDGVIFSDFVLNKNNRYLFIDDRNRPLIHIADKGIYQYWTSGECEKEESYTYEEAMTPGDWIYTNSRNK